MKKNGITLITLVVTIIVLLILAGISVAIVVGPDGVIKQAQNAQVDSRYATIMDKVKIRETDLEIAYERNEEDQAETAEAFIDRMLAEKLITDIDTFNKEERTISLGRLENGLYKYTINLVESASEHNEINEIIKILPNANLEENSHLKRMTLIIKTTTRTTTVSLPISNTAGLSINWDAGNENSEFETNLSSSNPSHTYTLRDEFEVQIDGVVEGNSTFGGQAIPSVYTNPYIVELVHWGENGFTSIGIIGGSLRGTIPQPSRKSFEKVESFDEPFKNCTLLEGNIPEAMFANTPKLITFGLVFSGLSNLSGSIPGNLFAKTPDVTTFISAFSGCSGLTGSIPANLFRFTTKVDTFYATFSSCSGLTGAIPSQLFANTPNVTSFSNTFSGCSGLESIPANLFANCTKTLNFQRTFASCSGLTGNAPKLWNMPNVSSHAQCFNGCTNLSNKEDIPTDWK